MGKPGNFYEVLIMAKPPYPENSKFQDFSVRGIARFYDHDGGRKRGYEEGATKNEVKNQMPEDKHGAKYDNDAKGWLRGTAKGEPNCYSESAEGYENFDKSPPRDKMRR
jgi:hypothetical protein